MLKKKKRRDADEVPGAGMADIAFLLLVFFLVVTTIDVDTGIGMQLPPPPDDEEPPPIRERNIMNILVNAQGQILLNEEPVGLAQVQDRVIEFVNNHGEDPDLSESPRQAVVSIMTDRQTRYDDYIDMLDEVMGAYRELRDAMAREMGEDSYEAYSDRVPHDENIIREEIPQNISLAEPDPGN